MKTAMSLLLMDAFVALTLYTDIVMVGFYLPPTSAETCDVCPILIDVGLALSESCTAMEPDVPDTVTGMGSDQVPDVA